MVIKNGKKRKPKNTGALKIHIGELTKNLNLERPRAFWHSRTWLKLKLVRLKLNTLLTKRSLGSDWKLFAILIAWDLCILSLQIWVEGYIYEAMSVLFLSYCYWVNTGCYFYNVSNRFNTRLSTENILKIPFFYHSIDNDCESW